MTDWEAAEAGASGGDSWPEVDRSAEEEAGRSPNWLLVAAAGAVAVGAFALVGGIGLNLIGYATSSLATFTLVALFRRRSVRRSALVGISASQSINLAAFALLGIGFALSLVHAWFIASYFS